MALKGLLNSVFTIAFGNAHLVDDDGNDCNFNPSQKQVHQEGEFQMPVHYPRYKRCDYEKMEEWKLDCLLRQYGLCFDGSLQEKRDFAIGAFLWPDQIVDN